MPTDPNQEPSRTEATVETAVRLPLLLCFGGTDPSGGAGLPADARAAAAFGAHACGIVTAVVAQNTRGAARSEPMAAALVRAQVDTLQQDVWPDAIKTGLLASRAQVEIVVDCVDRLKVPLVVDTVFAPSSGVRFCDDETMDAVRALLLPRCALVTPNRGEAEALCGFALDNEVGVRRALRLLMETGAGAVLLKGGHFLGEVATDWLAWRSREKPDAVDETALDAPRLDYEVRGTGCQLATAIAAQLAGGVVVEVAAARAKMWLWREMEKAAVIGGGRRVTLGALALEVNDET